MGLPGGTNRVWTMRARGRHLARSAFYGQAMYQDLKSQIPLGLFEEIENIVEVMSTSTGISSLSDADLEKLDARIGAIISRASDAMESHGDPRSHSANAALSDLHQFDYWANAQLEIETARRDLDRRAAWLSSEEHTRSRKRAIVALGVGLAGLAVIFLSWQLPRLIYQSRDASDSLVVDELAPIGSGLAISHWLGITAGFLMAIAGFLSSAVLRITGREDFAAGRRLAELNRETAQTALALSEATDDPTRLIEYWTSTQQRLDRFHNDARGQLRNAYFLSQASAATGFGVVLVLGIAAAAFTSSTTGTIVVGGIATVAAALAGYISHTFQVTYDRALRQTMAYFEQPVIVARLLHGERLLNQFPEGSEARNQALLEIVRAATKGAGEESTA